jgi:hypothetical protein
VTDQLITLGLPFLSLCLAIASLILASARQTGLAWTSLLAAWSIWPLLLMIGLSDSSAHGTGLYYLDLFALFALPFVTLIALALVFAIFAIVRRQARAANSEDTDPET